MTDTTDKICVIFYGNLKHKAFQFYMHFIGSFLEDWALKIERRSPYQTSVRIKMIAKWPIPISRFFPDYFIERFSADTSWVTPSEPFFHVGTRFVSPDFTGDICQHPALLEQDFNRFEVEEDN